jgi:hypothetical protein
MKKSILVFLVLAISSMLFNLYKIDWNKSLFDENSIALIGVLASGCAILLIIILKLSIKISEKEK